MTIRSTLALLLIGISTACIAETYREISWNWAQQLLGMSIEELRKTTDMSVSEDSDYVDEDEVTIHTQRWHLRYPDGNEIVIATDDGLATVIWVLSEEFATDRGIRVGDRVAEVIRAYPDSRTFDGSSDVLSTEFRLYAESGNLSFTFRDPALWQALRDGDTFHVDDAEVREAKVWLIAFTDGNRFACGEVFPCPHVPDWISSE